MDWDGTERRKNIRYCDAHIGFAENIAIIKTTVLNLDKRINGSIDAIEKHIEHGTKWRIAIAGVAVSLILALGSGIFAYGQLTEKVKILYEKKK